MKKLLNETIIYGMGAILPRIILVVLNPLYIKFIENEEFAKFGNLYALISFVNIFLSFGFETSYFRFSAEKDREPKTFNTAFWFLFALSTVFLLSCIVFNRPIAEYFGYAENPEYILWFALIAFFDNLCVIPFAWLRFHNKPIKYSAIRIVATILQTIFVFGLFLFIPHSVSEKMGLSTKVSYPFFANLFASIVTFILLIPVILKVRASMDKTLLIQMFKYSWPVMIAGFAFMVNENFDKYIQYYKIDKADAGSYAGCYKIAVLMTLFVTAYRMGIEPYFFKEMNNKNAKNTYAKVTEYFAFFASAVAMGIIANISWIMKILVPNHTYWNAIDIVPIIVIANLCFGIYYNFSTWYKVTDRTFVGTIISWLGALITISLNLWLLGKYGFMISAWVTLLAYLVMMVVSYLLGQKYYPIPYRVGKMLFFLILLSIFSYIAVKIFDYNFWMGNILFVIYTGILLFSEKDFILSKVRK